MKRFLLLLCLCPLFSFAQDISDEHKFADVLLSSRSRSEPSLRADALPPATLDSTYVLETTFGDEYMIAKYAYQYDEDDYIIKRQNTGYANGSEVYQIHTIYAYEPRKYYWIEQIDSIYEQNRYTSKSKYTRTYNEEAYLTDYREYQSNYDSPWGDPLQIYSAIGFNEDNMPIVFMDTLVPPPPAATPYIVRRWAVEYGQYANIESMTSYVESDKEWIPEVKYVISYDDLWPVRTMEVFTKNGDEWTEKIGEVITDIDGRSNRSSYQKKDEKGDIIQSFRFEHFYNETATHNESINNMNALDIILDNSSRTLTVDLKDAQKGHVTIVNTSGRIVQSEAVNQSKSQISLAKLQSGYYIVCIRTSGQYISRPVILE